MAKLNMKPTPAMMEAGVLAYNLTGLPATVVQTAEDHVELIWQAMLSAAVAAAGTQEDQVGNVGKDVSENGQHVSDEAEQNVAKAPANPAQVTDAVVEAAMSVPPIPGRGPNVFDEGRMRAALTAAIGANGQAVQDTWFTDRALPVRAMSGDVEDNRVLKLHFRRPVTDDDRKAMCDALNLHQASLTHPAPSGQAVASTASDLPSQALWDESRKALASMRNENGELRAELEALKHDTEQYVKIASENAEPAKLWPIDTDDQVEVLARECGIDNRKYMTPKDYGIWCEQQRKFARLAAESANVAVPRPAIGAVKGDAFCDAETHDMDVLLGYGWTPVFGGA